MKWSSSLQNELQNEVETPQALPHYNSSDSSQFASRALLMETAAAGSRYPNPSFIGGGRSSSSDGDNNNETAAAAAMPKKKKILIPGATRVGWIGTGVMGAAMAYRIQSAGYEVSIYARDPSKPLPLSLLRRGAHLAPSPAYLARSSDVLFTILSHPYDVRSLFFSSSGGGGGILSALPEGSAFVDSTSSRPDLAREIASAARSRNFHAIDAPVSGGDVGARDGNLAIFAGGDDEETVIWLSPLLEILGKVTYMGPPGSGQSAKIANQIAVTGSMLGLSEALFFIEKAAAAEGAAGLDAKAFLEAVKGGAAGSKAMELFGERILGRDLRPGGYAEYLVKDLGMALDSADDADDGTMMTVAALPGAALFHQLYLAMVANGDGKLGSHGLISVLERINGKKPRSS